MAVDIETTDITNGSVVSGEWTGTGFFDTLIAAVNKNIEIQFDEGRIDGNTFATVYLGALQSTIQTSAQLVIEAEKLKLQKFPSGR